MLLNIQNKPYRILIFIFPKINTYKMILLTICTPGFWWVNQGEKLGGNFNALESRLSPCFFRLFIGRFSSVPLFTCQNLFVWRQCSAAYLKMKTKRIIISFAWITQLIKLWRNKWEKWLPARDRKLIFIPSRTLGIDILWRKNMRKKTQRWKDVFYVKELILWRWKNFVVGFFSQTQKALILFLLQAKRIAGFEWARQKSRKSW